MKTTITISLLLLCLAGVGQGPQFRNTEEPVITDSVIWRVVSVLNIGDVKCNHEWVYSDTWAKGDGISCLVDHHGFHCDWNDRERYAICRICKRKEHQKEQWYQHRKEHVPSEYEIIDSDSGEYKINDNNNGYLYISDYKYITESYKLPKDTLVQTSQHMWYNFATWELIDSTQHYMTMNLIINLWDEYKQECWNDSTSERIHITIYEYRKNEYEGIGAYQNVDCKYCPEDEKFIKEVIEDAGIMKYLRYELMYSHKEPTLEGFMEFIRRRGK